MAFPFTINGHTYTKTGASTNYDFSGYGWITALANLIVDVVAVAVASDGLTATSTTSLAIATGAKTFTIQTGKAFVAGTYGIATSAANSANYMHFQVTSYNSGTGALVTDVQDIGGSGTLADWNISISGTRGAVGATGSNGTNGTNGTNGAGVPPNLTLTNPATAATVTFANNSTQTWVGAYALSFTFTAGTSLTFPTAGTLATLAGAEALTNKTYNGNTLTAGTYTITGAASKTLTFNNTMTLAGTDGQTYTHPAASDTMAGLATAQTFSKAQRGAFVALTDGATIALDLSLGNQYRVALAGNRTLGVPTNIVEGQQGVINIRQDTTGSRTLAYSWPYEWFGGSAGTLSTPGCTRDQLVYSVDVYNSGTMTTTIATPGVGTFTAHGFTSGQKVQITTTGALPTGLTASTSYYLRVIDANTFNFCTSLANVAAGTYIATSGSQSGTHTITGCSIVLALNKAAA